MDTLPLFPLSTVLLPGASLPLHVFEARYRQLTVDLLNDVVPDRRFGVVGIKQGWEVGDDNIDSMYDVGCSAVLQHARQLPEGRYDITGTGERRFRLLQIDREAAPYLMARVQWLPDVASNGDSDRRRERLDASARFAHERYHATGLRGDRYEAPDAALDSAELSYTLAEDCVLTTEDRQALLAETDPLERLRLARTLMLREAEFLRELRAIPAPLAQFAEQTSVN
ncbi:LON peptidase substrate-binding domain-containing protein [Parasphingorhabdus pacifica]